jgi:hypothetical protein
MRPSRRRPSGREAPVESHRARTRRQAREPRSPRTTERDVGRWTLGGPTLPLAAEIEESGGGPADFRSRLSKRAPDPTVLHWNASTTLGTRLGGPLPDTWSRSNPVASSPRQQTVEFSGGCSSLAAPMRLLVLVRLRSDAGGSEHCC